MATNPQQDIGEDVKGVLELQEKLKRVIDRMREDVKGTWSSDTVTGTEYQNTLKGYIHNLESLL